jgi:hypothetical protein
MHLSEKFFSQLPSSVKFEVTKFFTVFSDTSGKKVYFSGKRVQVLHYDKKFGDDFVEVSEETAKQKHLGKVRCLGSVKNEYSLIVFLSKYFTFESPAFFESDNIKGIALKETKLQAKKKVKKIPVKGIVTLTDSQPNDRDENKLVLAYRNAQTLKEKNKIFRTILHHRGVNGKTWSTIIKNYVSYNKHKFAHLLDRSENDFYQEIVIALHKQVEKWFDTEKNCCFSTYAWYVINCAFHRILQSLSTQKRKAPYLWNNVELDDQENSWDESISAEKTQLPFCSFEDELDKSDLCAHINKLFELKEVKAPEELKKDLLKVVRDKSTMQNSLYLLAKKYKISVDELFKLEMQIRDNIRNSMYKDILLNIQYDINADDFIAKKYRRSKGHVIKMKRQLSSLVKSKLKGVAL